jgi:hypothetical protein
MEQLAVKVSKAKFLHPATAAQIEELMTLPPYDCTQVACVSELQHRNSIVRSRLEALIAGKTRSEKLVASEHPRVGSSASVTGVNSERWLKQ